MRVPAIAVGEPVASSPQPSLRGRARAKWRRNRAVELAMAGHSYDEIAELVGYANRGTAWRAVQDALSEHTALSVQEYRALALARYDALLSGHWDAATAEGNVRSAELILKVIAAESKLLGLDPVSHEAAQVNTAIVGGDSEEYIAALKAIRERTYL